VAAGVISFTDAVRAVQLRGRFMQEAIPVGVGAMAAILGLSVDEVDGLCVAAANGEVVSAANRNGPDQTVISGHAAAVARVVELAKAAGAKRAVPLPVSAPFHCALMQPAATRLAPVLAEVRFSAPTIPVYANVDARPIGDGADARGKLIRQVVSPVRWHELIENMVSAGIATFVEVGPGNVLAGLVRRIRRDLRTLSVSDADGVAQAARELGVAA
jgi:[acyl-carrier-protein] S-malonyltransferase